jgi:N-acetylneuraminate synthase/N,N'-diacetyllegionaminate synthase
MKEISIPGRKIGPGNPCFIIAEVGTNHNMNLNTAMELVRAVSDTGADAVKFQTYHWYDIVHPGIRASDYGYPSGKPWKDIIESRLSMPREWYPAIFAEARRLGLIPFSTPHCPECAEFLNKLGVPLFKVASMELTNLPFLTRLASCKKPVILSTGMGSVAEIGAAVEAFKSAGLNDIAITHCVSLYPPSYGEINLLNIPSLAGLTGLPVGFSDHSAGAATAVAAVALGACIIEKHITLDRNAEGPDHKFAMEPAEFKQMVTDIRNVQLAMGNGERKLSSREEIKRDLYRKSLIAAVDISAGEKLSEENIMVTRPATGIPPAFLEVVLGMAAAENIGRYQPIQWHMLKVDIK